MEKERFENLKKMAKTVDTKYKLFHREFDGFGMRYWPEMPKKENGHYTEQDFKAIANEINFDGDIFRSTKRANEYIISMLLLNNYTEEEWEKIFSYIEVYDFNNEFAKMVKDISSDLKILESKNWLRDLHLEFWQGGLSFGTHHCNPESKVNTPQNGEEYIEIINDMHNKMKEMVEKYKRIAVKTISYRFDYFINGSMFELV